MKKLYNKNQEISIKKGENVNNKNKGENKI